MFLIAFIIPVYGQDMSVLERKINQLNEHRTKWSQSRDDKAYDSLAYYNRKLEELILDFTSKNNKTLHYPFKNLGNAVQIVTSEDGLFRIYTWNTLEGGTMQFFQNVYQYSHNGKIYATSNNKSDGNSGYHFYEINDVSVDGKRYYVSSSVSIGSSALSYYQAKIFAIEHGELNPDAKLIKTKSGIKNTLGYEVDLSRSSNRNRQDDVIIPSDYKLMYDRNRKMIILPLIQADGYISKRKIKYQLKSKYFEMVK